MATKQSTRRTPTPPAAEHAPTWMRICERLRIRRPRAERVDSHAPPPYLTDGVNLYRFVGWVDRSMSAMFAELEDCRSLEIVLVTAEELARSALRPVPISLTRAS